jgi:regulator of sigma E protease
MAIFLGILLTLVVLLIVVMIHEIGHFVTARLTGMRVEEFGIGIPPRARSLWTDKKGTEYTLNWLPIGGFVRIFGENPQDNIGNKK